jgi:hypothetical protein
MERRKHRPQDDRPNAGSLILLSAALVCCEMALTHEPLRRRNPATEPQHAPEIQYDFIQTKGAANISTTTSNTYAQIGDSLSVIRDSITAVLTRTTG